MLETTHTVARDEAFPGTAINKGEPKMFGDGHLGLSVTAGGSERLLKAQSIADHRRDDHPRRLAWI